jgi:agmatine deiminase
VYGEITRKLSPGEIVRIIVHSKAHETGARRVLTRAGVDLARVEFYRIPTNRGWTRDFGPIFLRSDRSGEVAVAGFGFNAWAKYPDWKKDALVSQRVARALGTHLFRPVYQGRLVVLEGGAIDVNGRGTLLATEECLLDPMTQVRNPGQSRQELETVLRDFLGANNIFWLGRGIAGDDTHGHVDDLCRFVNPNTVVLCREHDSRDANYLPLQENRERLEGMKLEDGSNIQIIPLPMPQPLYLRGQRLPASYANFYFGNEAVLVPTFNDPNDRIALGIIAEAVKDRPVIGIHAVDLVWGLGTIHCMTHEQPA